MDMEQIHFIACCMCPDMPAYSEMAWRTLNRKKHLGWSGARAPHVYRGEAEIKKCISELQQTTRDCRRTVQYLAGLTLQKDPFSYYFILNMDGTIYRMWDLNSGMEVK